MSDPLPYKNDIPMKAKTTTKKSAAVKRGHKIATTYTVADLRASLRRAAAELIAVEVWLDQKVNEMAKDKQ